MVDRLLKHPTFATSGVTALIRKADKAPAFESLGIKPILGSYDDHVILEQQASLSDIIFSIVRVSVELNECWDKLMWLSFCWHRRILITAQPMKQS